MQLKTIAVACSVALVVGCAPLPKPGATAWDPPAGRDLFEQLPNWDDAARKTCGGHLHPDEARRRGLSQRC